MSAYRFHMFSLAEQLAARGALARLITAMPRRSVGEVSADLVVSRPVLALLRHGFERLVRTSSESLNRLVIRDFDRWARRQVEGADVVTSLSSFGSATLLAAAARGARTICDRGSWHIVEQRAVLTEEAERWGWPVPRFDSWIVDRELQDYESSDRIFVPSTPVAASFVRQGVRQEKLVVVPYGVDVARFHPGPRRANFDRVVSVGTVGMRKGHQYVARAAERLGGVAQFTFVGPVERRFLERVTIPSNVALTGAVSRADVADLMRASGIFVLASIEEGLALVLLQAMASGLPVVATTSTGAADIVRDGVDGFVVADRSADALAAALTTLIEDPDLADRMGESARARALDVGSADRYGARALDAIREVAAA